MQYSDSEGEEAYSLPDLRRGFSSGIPAAFEAPSSSSRKHQYQQVDAAGSEDTEALNGARGLRASFGGYSSMELCRAVFLLSGALVLSVFAFSNVNSGFLQSSSENGIFHSFTSLEDIPRDVLFANFTTPDQQKLFAMFVEKYARGVEKSAYGDMFARFKLNLDKIDERNSREAMRGGTARHGINKFTGTSDEDLAKMRGGKKPSSDSAAYLNIRGLAKPADVASYSGTATSVDWSGVYTTAVRDQGYCGGCWAFSAAAQMESDGIRQGLLTTSNVLSPQQMISCSSDNDGCSGGWTEFAFSYAMETGIELDSDYPYTSYDEDVDKCANKDSLGVVQVDSFYVITSEDSMIDYVMETGPLSVCIDSSDWDSYMDGIVASCGSNVDHCVQLVGVDLGEGSWKIRNTWGTDWGEGGYIRLQTNQNMCGITDDPIYTNVSLLETISSTSAPSFKPTHAPSTSADLPEKPTTAHDKVPTLPPTAPPPTLYPTSAVVVDNNSPTLYPTVAAPTLFPTAGVPTMDNVPTVPDQTIVPTSPYVTTTTSKPSMQPTLLPTMPPSLPAILPASQTTDTTDTTNILADTTDSKEIGETPTAVADKSPTPEPSSKKDKEKKSSRKSGKSSKGKGK